MTFADIFTKAMREPTAWNKSCLIIAKRIDKMHVYDKMEPDLGFINFADGSQAGVRPLSHEAWVSRKADI